jgi:hypothetical protein
MKKQPNSLRRATVKVEVVITWPADGKEWDAISAITRNQIRDHLDAACDLIERWAT